MYYFFLTNLFILTLLFFPPLISCEIFSLHPVKVPNYNSLRNLVSDTSIYGSSDDLNYYYANLYLGNPPKKQAYIVDTGSSITTSPCQPYCEKCGKHLNSYYTVKEPASIISCESEQCKMVSSTCNGQKQCGFSISYSEGSSLSGIFINETIRIGDDYNNTKGNWLPIGCTTKENNLFLTQLADGIMGLSNSDTSFVSMLYKRSIISENVFSLCLSQKGGYFAIGEINKKYHKEPTITYIGINKSGFYNIKLNSIIINSSNISLLNDKGDFKYVAIVDSGTTVTYIPNEPAEAILKEFHNYCELKENKGKCGTYKKTSDLGPCYFFDNMTHMENALQIWPNITFEIQGGYSYVWTPLNYYFNNTDDVPKATPKACLGFISSNGNKFTFGSTWMHGHDIIFDRSNSSIGFVKADCDRGKEPIGKENQTESDNKEDEEKEKKCIQEDITETRKFLIAYAFVCIILLCIIIFLCLAIYHLRKGENYYCIKMKHGNLVETSQPQLNDVEAIDISEPKVEVELANTNPQN